MSDSLAAPPHESPVQFMAGALDDIRTALDDVFPLTLKMWEDLIRESPNAELELARWVHLASKYRKLAGYRPLTREQRWECLAVMLACMNGADRDTLRTVKLSAISREEALEVAAFFHAREG